MARFMGCPRERFWLKALFAEHALQKSENLVELASGELSEWYVDGRQITTHPIGLCLIADILYDFIKDTEVTAIGGPASGSIPISTAVAMLSAIKGIPIKSFWVNVIKTELIYQFPVVQGPLTEDDLVLIVDDVTTTGGSLVKALEGIDKITKKQYGVFTLVNRDNRATHFLEQEGLNLTYLFTLNDLIELYPPIEVRR
jgi:orotate phosphoribosyltransferase